MPDANQPIDLAKIDEMRAYAIRGMELRAQMVALSDKLKSANDDPATKLRKRNEEIDRKNAEKKARRKSPKGK